MSAVCKKTIGIGPTVPEKLKNPQNFATFFKKIAFHRNIEVWPQKTKNYIGRNEVFHSDAKKHQIFSSTTRFRTVPYFVKTDNIEKWG